MNLTETHQIRPNHKLYSICDELCFKSKNLYNAALFEFRQSYFDKEEDTLTWQNINRIFNQSNQFDYRELPSKVSNILSQSSSCFLSITTSTRALFILKASGISSVISSMTVLTSAFDTGSVLFRL